MKVAARRFQQPGGVVSYTLRGRIETRLAGALAPVLVAAVLSPVLHKWWPLELVGLMLLIGLVLDVLVYHPLLPYQPGWAAVPLGLLELGLTLAAARLLDLGAPLRPALALLRRPLAARAAARARGAAAAPPDAGRRTAASSAAPVSASRRPRRWRSLAVLGIAWAVEPPTVRLAAGVHQGPLVLDHAQTVVGEAGAIVRGGILITADDVTLREPDRPRRRVRDRGPRRRERRDRRRRRRVGGARRDQRPPERARDPRLRDPLPPRSRRRRGSTSRSPRSCPPASSRTASSSAAARGSSRTWRT